eukprot:CAMPEP_0202689218 /NCGR_PEP_ID=MMETSP1385-20130828/4532_1 /ASSEMBLY_ACC=CAM_ASM_000861 /TAXON_ID=933848 /ORGANISM="Elphidium margaritaceum" /LENGTH=110 /DNA_ID=CAMNT_0049344321 /DNA_START=113 /DNA_END=445 /DNA_ORIENTATION=+
MPNDWSDFCECFFARMRNNVQQFNNVLSNNRDSFYNGPNGGHTNDPFALDGTSGDTELFSSTTLLCTLFLILILGVLMAKQRTLKRDETPSCSPLHADRNDRRFDPPEVD